MSKKDEDKRPKLSTITGTLQLYEGSKTERLIQLRDDWSNCSACELGEIRKIYSTQEVERGAPPIDIVFGDGNPDTADILIVGEAPGEEEKEYQVPFVGASGELLNQLIASTTDDEKLKEFYREYNRKSRKSKKEIDSFMETMVEYRRQRFFITNAVCCQPPENRTPTINEIAQCWDRLWNTIYIIDPILIITLGSTALAAVTRRANAKVSKDRGHLFDVKLPGRFGTVVYPVVPIYHPSYLLRKADWKEPFGDCQKSLSDFRTALSLADKIREQDLGIPIPNRDPY